MKAFNLRKASIENWSHKNSLRSRKLSNSAICFIKLHYYIISFEFFKQNFKILIKQKYLLALSDVF